MTAIASTVRLREMDRAALASHFLRLGPEDRRLRFGSGIGDAGIRAYVARIDFHSDCLFAMQDDDLRVVAVVHVAMTGDAAELGLSVLPRWRGRGHGHALLRRAITWLRNRGIHEVFVHCLAENAAITHLAQKSGMRVVYSGGEREARLELAPATPQSLFAEWNEEGLGQAVQLIRRNGRLVQAFFGR
jgi:RimJ/RimL family protein N-acetyltransferase